MFKYNLVSLVPTSSLSLDLPLVACPGSCEQANGKVSGTCVAPQPRFENTTLYRDSFCFQETLTLAFCSSRMMGVKVIVMRALALDCG